MLNSRSRGAESRPSPFAIDLGSDIGDNKAIGGGYVGALPASLGTQMAYASQALRADSRADGDRDMFGRLMLARMNNLEEGFREVVHEMRGRLRREEKRSRSHDPRGRAPRSHAKANEKDRDGDNLVAREKVARLKPHDSQARTEEPETESGEEWEDEDIEAAPKTGVSL